LFLAFPFVNDSFAIDFRGGLVKKGVYFYFFLILTLFISHSILAREPVCELLFKSQQRSLEDIQQLRVLTFNMKDFHYTVEAKKISTKPLHQLELLGKNLYQLKPDIMILEEVNPLAVSRFQERFLNNEYSLFTTTGPLENMGIIFAVKNNLPFAFQLEQHRGIRWTDPLDLQDKPLFPRDVPGLKVFIQGESVPRLILLGHHGKSKRDREVSKGNSVDLESEIMREAQASALSKIVNQYKFQFPGIAVLLAGDFNMEIQDQEMKPLRRHMKDSFEVSPEPVPPRHQMTHTYFPNNQRLTHKIDMILGTRRFMKSVKKTFVHFFRDQRGQILFPPKSYEERERRVSDHMPLVVDLDFLTLFGLQHP